MAKAKKAKRKASKRGSAAGYRVFVLTTKRNKRGIKATFAKPVGRLAKGLTTAEALEILKRLAPKKSTTAVAITKTGTIHLAARARKSGGKSKTSQALVRSASKVLKMSKSARKRVLRARKTSKSQKTSKR